MSKEMMGAHQNHQSDKPFDLSSMLATQYKTRATQVCYDWVKAEDLQEKPANQNFSVTQR